MDLSVIIVTWNSETHIARCLRSVVKAATGIESEIILIDNASTDRTSELVRDRFPHVKLIPLLTNEGFARACNRGIAASSGECICFLNPDTEVLGVALVHLVNFLKSHPRGGIVGGTLKNADGSIQPSVRAFPTPLMALGMVLKFHHIPMMRKLLQRYFQEDFDYSVSQRVEQVMGAWFVARQDFLKEVGGFDERYFIWFEEVDLMREAYKRGWEVWYYPKAQVVHLSAQSFRQVDRVENQKRFLESMIKYVRKWHGLGAAIPLIIISPLLLALYNIFVSMKSKFKMQKSNVQCKN